MKIVNIFGGLGNQMFQYALMIALKSKYGEDVLADELGHVLIELGQLLGDFLQL